MLWGYQERKERETIAYVSPLIGYMTLDALLHISELNKVSFGQLFSLMNLFYLQDRDIPRYLSNVVGRFDSARQETSPVSPSEPFSGGLVLLFLEHTDSVPFIHLGHLKAQST